MTIHNDVHQVAESGSNHLVGVLPSFLLCVLFIAYVGATVYTNRRYKKWPLHRTVFWCFGILLALIALGDPIANRASEDFPAHMISHLLLGMLVPLLMVFAAPVSLLLRILSIPFARALSSVLKGNFSRIFMHPIVTAILNIGGLWLLYTTNLYSLMHENVFINLMIHMHVFTAGYLFTASIIYVGPIFHRKSFPYRATVLLMVLAGHGILSKYIYAHPPEGVTVEQAQLGSMMMYYGGDIIDGALIFAFCLQWFRAARPRVVKTRAVEGAPEK